MDREELIDQLEEFFETAGFADVRKKRLEKMPDDILRRLGYLYLRDE